MKRTLILVSVCVLLLLTQGFASYPTLAEIADSSGLPDPLTRPLGSAVSTASTPPSGWDEFSFTYNSNDYGEYPSLDLVPGMTIPRITFWDAEHEAIVTWHGGDVYRGFVINTPGTGLHKYPDMQVDSRGQPHLVWATETGDVYFSRYNLVSKAYETWFVGDGAYYQDNDAVPMPLSLALDSEDRAHIVYYRDKDGVKSLEYARWVAGLNYFDLFDHHTLAEDNTYAIGLGPSIAVAPDGSVHVVFYDWYNAQLSYLKRTPGSAWPATAERIQYVGYENVDYRTAIAVGNDGKPQVTYWRTTTGGLVYCKNGNTPADWTCSFVDSDLRAGRYHDIALDLNNNPHISYHFATETGGVSDGDLKYAYHNGTTWQYQVLDTQGDTGIDTSIAVDVEGKTHIAYYDANHSLRYWYENPIAVGTLGNVGCAWGSRQCNPCAANVVDSFNNLRSHGDILSFYVDTQYNPTRDPDTVWYNFEDAFHHHWQGLARPMADGEPYLITSLDLAGGVSGSPYPAAVFSVAHFGSRNTDGYRLGSNRVEKDFGWWTGTKLLPPWGDRVVHTEWMSIDQPHPGGLQMIGDFLAVPFTQAEWDVWIYDLVDPLNPSFVTAANLDGNNKKGLSTAALVQMDDGSYILAGYSELATLDFYRSTTYGHINSATNWELIVKIKVPEEAGAFGAWDWDVYQSLNFVTDCGSGQVYLIATGNDDDTSPLCLPETPCHPSSFDQATLYSVDVGSNSASITPVAGRIFYCNEEGKGTDHCNFDAAAGVYVDPSNQMILYATEHASDGYDESVKMKEFRPVPHSTCPTIADAWIEGFKSVQPDADFGFLMEYPEFQNVDMENLKTYGWEDKIWSVGWCAPPDYSYIMYEDKNPCSGRMTKLNGYGTYNQYPLSYMGGETSCIRLVKDSALRYSIDPVLGHQWDYLLDDVQIVGSSAPTDIKTSSSNDEIIRGLSVEVGPNTFPETMDVVFENITPPTHPHEGNYPTSYNFHLGLEGDIAPDDFVFSVPVTVTYSWSDEDLIGLDELSLAPFYWNKEDERWESAHGTCPSNLWPYFDEDSNTIIVEICKFGEYALWAWREPINVGVDELHDNRMTLDWTRAQAIAVEEGPGAEPEWYYLNALNNAGGHDYTLQAITSGELTDAVLGQYDVLLIPYYRDALSETEVQAVLRYVDGGGGLLFTGDCGFGLPNPELAAVYDTILQPECLFGPYPSTNAELSLDINTLHASMAVVTDVIHNWSQALVLYGEGESILTMPEDTWQDADWSGDFDGTIDPVDTFDAGSAYDTGCGRVAILGDSHYSDQDLSWTNNETVMKSILMWASEGTPCKVPADRYPVKVLLDEGHNNWLTLDWNRAAQLATIWGEGAAANEFILETLADNLGGAYSFNRNTDTLTRSLLKDYDALVIPQYGDAFSATEIAAVQDFVTRGGGLMILGDAYYTLPNPELAEMYGFQFREAGIFIGNANEGTFEIPLVSEHPAMAGANNYITSWGQAIAIADATNIMDTQMYDTYEDLNHNQTRDNGESGIYSMAVAFDTRCGRVIGFGDNVFSDSTLEWTDNDRVFRSMLDWLTDPNACHKNVLVDETHDNYLTVHWSRAEEIVANQGWGSPTYYILDTLSERLDDDFAFTANPDAELTIEGLLPFDAVVIPQYFEAMTEDEVKAVKSYVRQGGGVLFLGDSAYDNPNPELTKRFGFTFRNEVVFAPVPQAQPLLQLDAFANHPSVYDLIDANYDFTMEGGCSVELGYAAEPILTTSGLNAWRDYDWNDVYNSNIDEAGEFIIAAVYDGGCGRAAVIADDHFGNDPLYSTDNDELARELLHWISSGTECTAIGDTYIPIVLK